MSAQRGRLEALAEQVLKGQLGVSEGWQGADVVITSTPPASRGGGFYPDPRFVITNHDSELSWLFFLMKDIFSEYPGYGFWKEELFGRLGNTAMRFQSKNPQITAQNLLLSTLHDAFLISDEIETNRFETLLITTNNQIADDFVDRIKEEGFLTIEDSKNFLEKLGRD